MTRDSVYLRHILDAIARIETYVAVGRDRFLAETHWHDATIRQLEIISAGKLLSRLESLDLLREVTGHQRRRSFAYLPCLLLLREPAADDGGEQRTSVGVAGRFGPG